MNVKVTEILKEIHKLNPAEKHSFESISLKNLLHHLQQGLYLEKLPYEKIKVVISVPTVNRCILFGLENIQPLLMVKRSKNNVIVVKPVKRHSQTLIIPFFIEHAITNGLNLLRHKPLSSLKQIDISDFEGIVEMDKTYFLYSEKGQRKIKGRKPQKRGGAAKKRGISKEQVCVLVARDRDKLTFSRTSGKGRITKEQLDKMIGHKLSKELSREIKGLDATV